MYTNIICFYGKTHAFVCLLDAAQSVFQIVALGEREQIWIRRHNRTRSYLELEQCFNGRLCWSFQNATLSREEDDSSLPPSFFMWIYVDIYLLT